MSSIFDNWDQRVADRQRVRGPVTIPTAIRSDDRLVAWAEAALTSLAHEVATAQEGTRNDTLNKCGLRAYRIAEAGLIDHDRVTEVLGAADGGLNHPATARTLQSARAAAQQMGPAELPAEHASSDPFNPAFTSPSGDVPPWEQNADDAAAAAPAGLTVPARIDWHELWQEPDGDDWILEPLLPARRLVAIYSAPKVGKSLLMLELAAGIANGTPVLGVKPSRPHRVLYVDHENDPRGDIRTRLQAMRYAPKQLERLDYLSFPAMSTLDTERGGAELLNAALHYKSEVVIVDTASRTVAGEENANDTWLSWYRHTGAPLKRAGIAVIRLDHTGKDADKGMRGGSAKSGDIDAAWQMSRLTELADGVPETFRLKLDMARMRITENELTLERRVTPRLHHVALPGARQSAFEAKVAEVIACADRAELPRDAGRPAIEQAVRDASISASRNALAEAVRRRKTVLEVLGQSELPTCPSESADSDGQSAA